MKARSVADDTRLKVVLVLMFVALTAAGTWRAMNPKPFWDSQSLTAVSATAADLEESFRAVLGDDHAEFKQLNQNRLLITCFGRSLQAASALSARLEFDACRDFQRRGLGRVVSTEMDIGGWSDGDPSDFPLWRLHYVTRNLGFPSWHQLFENDGD